MPKVQSASKTKSASKAANTKPAKPSQAISIPDASGDASFKEKREPSAYNVFIKDSMSKWLAANPGKKAGEGMKVLGAQWKDHPSNPNRGKAAKSRAKKATSGKENGIPDSDDTIPSSDD